jgi:hypothetical protein
MYVIKRQQGKAAFWLASTDPESWGERDHARKFETRNDARRAAMTVGVSGDWSIEVAVGPPPLGQQ